MVIDPTTRRPVLTKPNGTSARQPGLPPHRGRRHPPATHSAWSEPRSPHPTTDGVPRPDPRAAAHLRGVAAASAVVVRLDRFRKAEIELTAKLVRSLLRDQHPDLADRPLELGARGWANQLWRLGDGLAVRFPCGPVPQTCSCSTSTGDFPASASRPRSPSAPPGPRSPTTRSALGSLPPPVDRHHVGSRHACRRCAGHSPHRSRHGLTRRRDPHQRCSVSTCRRAWCGPSSRSCRGRPRWRCASWRWPRRWPGRRPRSRPRSTGGPRPWRGSAPPPSRR